MSSKNSVYEVLSAFEGARSLKEYRAAKALCVRRFDAIGQMAFIDAARAARSRIGGAS